MERNEINQAGIKFFSRLQTAGLFFLVILLENLSITYGKSIKNGNIKQHVNSSKRHYVVTEEEIHDTYFIPNQQAYPVIPQYPVPIITQVMNPPQTEAKKPKNEHANKHEEKHVLFQPGTTVSEHKGHDEENGYANNPTQPESKKNEHAGDHETQHVLFQPGRTQNEHARNSKESQSSINVGTLLDQNRNVMGKINTRVNEILDSDNGNFKLSNDNNKESSSIKHFSSDDNKINTFRNVGCYKDALPRAVPSLEGSDPILNGFYKNRQEAVEKCARVAKSRGYQLFTIQNGGFCSSGPMAHRTFQIYGPASKCKGGLGGKWASDVYIFNVYAYELMIHTGIEQKSSTDANISVALYGVMGSSRHIPLRSHTSTITNDPFQSGQVDRFVVHTVPLSDITRLHVCLDNTGPSPAWYLEKVSIKDPRNKIFIFPCNCWLKGGKKGSITERNLLPAVVISTQSFKYIGCFKHPKTNNIPAQDYKILDGHPTVIFNKNTKPKYNDYVIEMCAQGTYVRGYMFFGIYNGKQCLSSSTFQDSYDKYGKAYDCPTTGRGGMESMAVYSFTDREPVTNDWYT